MMGTEATDRCKATTAIGGKTVRCQAPSGHDGRCHYHRAGGQGGSLVNWWGANPRPTSYIDDLGLVDLRKEVIRLRELCDANGIEWEQAPVGRGDVDRGAMTATVIAPTEMG